tara:strand:- start:256 stop:510 length:255 start_codon:yes stop_codon:yes gene_type:complete
MVSGMLFGKMHRLYNLLPLSKKPDSFPPFEVATDCITVSTSSDIPYFYEESIHMVHQNGIVYPTTLLPASSLLEDDLCMRHRGV